MNRVSRVVPAAAILLAVALPYCALTLPGVFDSPFNSAGTLQTLTLCLIFAGLATGYDLLFGRTGMLSFGHALFFATGTYLTTILVTRAGWSLWAAAPVAILSAGALAAAVGAIALRTTGVAFAMVTLAFAQAGAIAISRNPGGVTGGSDGLSLDPARVPAALVGVANTVNLYWLALAYLVLVMAVVGRVLASPGGRVLTAIRDNEPRVRVLGVDTRYHKLAVFVLAAILAAGGGVVYAVAVGGASPRAASTDLTLSLLIMVVLGGTGTRWGPVLGAVVYVYLDQRLTDLASGATTADLPDWVRRIAGQPLLLLGTGFILLVYLAPGGLSRIRHRATRA